MDQQEKQICPIHKIEMKQVVIRNEQLLGRCCKNCIVQTIDFDEYVQQLALRRDSFIKNLEQKEDRIRKYIESAEEKIKSFYMLNVPEQLFYNLYFEQQRKNILQLAENSLNTFSHCQNVEEIMYDLQNEENKFFEKYQQFLDIQYDIYVTGKFDIIQDIKPPIQIDKNKLLQGEQKKIIQKRSQSLQK